MTEKLFSIGTIGLYRRTLSNHCFITTYYFIGRQVGKHSQPIELFRL